MEYQKFREAIKEAFWLKGPWQIDFDWDDEARPMPSDFRQDALWEIPYKGANELRSDLFDAEFEMESIEMEREEGPFFHLINISMVALYEFYEQNGWEATLLEIEKHVDQDIPVVNRKKTIRFESKLSDEGKELFDRLKGLRKEIAEERRVPPYVVFMNRTLYEMCVSRPSCPKDMLELYGVGEKNFAMYGARFLEAIQMFTQERSKAVCEEEKKFLKESVKVTQKECVI